MTPKAGNTIWLNYRANKILIYHRSFIAFVILFICVPLRGLAADGLENGAMAGHGRLATLRTILTVKDSCERLAEEPVISIDRTADKFIATVFIDPAKQLQTIEGFGGAFTEAAAVIWRKLRAVTPQPRFRFRKIQLRPIL